MSILFFEGFETVGTETGLANEATTRPRISQRFHSSSAGGTPATTGFFLMDDQFGQGGFAWNHGINRDSFLRVEIPNELDKVIVVGCWVHIPETTDIDIVIFEPEGGASPGSNNHFSVIINARKNLQVSGAGTAISVEVLDAFVPGAWHHVESKFRVDTTTGFVEVRVDGVEVINETNVDTQDFDGNVLSIKFGPMALTTPLTGVGEDFFAMDDIYILKTEGGAPDDFLGPRAQVRSLPPTGDNLTQWDTTSIGTVHYTLIDENGADSADYVETTTNTDRDEFDLTDIAESEGTFYAVKIEAEATDEGDTNNTLDVEVESGGSRSQTSYTVSDSASTVYNHYAATDPQGGGAWTKSRVDAMRAGIEFNT